MEGKTEAVLEGQFGNTCDTLVDLRWDEVTLGPEEGDLFWALVQIVKVGETDDAAGEGKESNRSKVIHAERVFSIAAA